MRNHERSKTRTLRMTNFEIQLCMLVASNDILCNCCGGAADMAVVFGPKVTGSSVSIVTSLQRVR